MSRYTDLTPRMKPVSPRRSSIVSVLDVGTSKVVCLIARLEPAGDSDLLRGRTHRAQIIGIGHQRSRGLKAGAVVDLDAAAASVGVEWDVRSCSDFRSDPGRWRRCCPDGPLPS
jgi:cell division protein FtsA